MRDKWSVRKIDDLWVVYQPDGLPGFADPDRARAFAFAVLAAKQEREKPKVTVAYAGYAHRRPDGTYQLFPRLGNE